MRIAPTAIMIVPSIAFQVRASPRNMAANTMTNIMESRSSAATPPAGPVFKLKKYHIQDSAPATPESAINVRVLPSMDPMLLYDPRRIVVTTRKKVMIMERIVVPSVESIPCIPILPKIATNEALMADRIANKIQGCIGHIVAFFYPRHNH